MKLTKTQRDFITTQLKVKAREKKVLHVRTEAEKKDDAITGALDEYLKRESKVLDALRELEKVAGTEQLVKDFEGEISVIQNTVKTAKREDADKTFKQAYKDLETIKDRAAKEVQTATKNPTYFAKLDEARKALEALKKHPQKDHVQNEITQAEQKLAAAVQANEKAKYADALKRVAEAKKLCDDGKSFADQFNAYRIARAPAVGILEVLKPMFSNPASADKFQDKIDKADAKAAPDTRDYAKATEAVNKVKTELGDLFKKSIKDGIQKQIDELKKVKPADSVAEDIKKIEALRDAVDGKAAAGDWAVLGVLGNSATRHGVETMDRITRGKNYVDAKKKATAAIALLKPNPALASKVAEFEKILKDNADPLATPQAQRYEEGIDLCKKVETDCAALAKIDAASKKYQKDKESLTKRLEAVEKLPAAAHMADAISSLKGLLSEAEKRVAAGTDDWSGGLEWLARLAADLTSAEEQAKSLTGATGAKDAANGATDEASIKKAVTQIRADAKKLAGPPDADLVKDELAKIEAACAEALKQAGTKLEEAKKSLDSAADLLIAARNTKALHANFDRIYDTADKRREELAKLIKNDPYKALKSKVDLIPPLLKQAKDEAKAQNYTGAAATIGQANVAAKAIETDAEGLKAFDARADSLRKAQKKLSGSDKSEVGAILTEADKKAADLKFDEADKLLTKAQVKMDALKIKTLFDSGDNDKVLETAKEMLKTEGGTELLDQFVKGMSGEEHFDLIAKLAKERFGIELTSDAGHKTVSAKAIWEVMAEVPEKHATHSPSLKSVKREKPDSSGGAYSWVDKSVSMNGRPNDSRTEKFDAATREKGLGIPPDHDNANDPYAPIDDTPANYFNMTVLHEVGHAVDDRLGFMNGKAGQAAFGGWKEYTDLKVIADTVATAKKYDKDYVFKRMNGFPPDPVAMPKDYAGGEAAWKKAQKAVDDWFDLACTKGKIWFSFSNSKKAAIGDTVYQEAYSNQWVSYLLAERSKGVTAYQWRAPGEWFAELYMAWYGKKLKPNHPFASWLKAL